MKKQLWQVGPLIFDSQRRTLQLADQYYSLEPKPAQLLLLMAQNTGEPVSREQLINEIWQGRVVSDSAINRAVSLLRKAFAELDPATEYIVTIPKLGYCLLAETALLSAATDTNEAEAPADSLTNNLIAGAADSADKTWPSTANKSTIPNAKTRFYHHRLLLWLLLLVSIMALAASWVWLQRPATGLSNSGNVIIPVPVTSFDGAEFSISSSQNNELLYHRRDSENNSQLWLRQQQTDTLLVAAPAEALNSSISPDGSKAVYRRLQDNRCQIMLLYLNSAAAEQVLFDCPSDSTFQASWTQDSQQFYYRLRQSKTEPYLVYRYLLATAIKQQLTLADPASFNGAVALTVADDGKQLAIASYITADSSKLSVYRLAEGQLPTLQYVTDLSIGVIALSWPAGQSLLVASRNQLYQLTDNHNLQTYFYSAQLINSLASSKTSLYFATQQQQANIWRQPLGVSSSERSTSSAEKPLIVSSRLDILPRVNQQDSEIIFLSTRQGIHQIWRKPHNGPEYLLAALPAPAGFVRLSWSFDQQRIYFSQQGAIYQLELATGQQTQLLAAEHQAFVVNHGPDNNTLIYSSNKTGDWQLWRYQINGKQHQQLTTSGGYSGYLQGDNLYFSKFHHDGLWRRDLSSGEEQLLLADFDKVNWLNWQLQDNNVVYFKPETGIFRQSLVPGSPAELLLAVSPRFVHHYSVSDKAVYFVKHLPLQGDVYQLPMPSKTQ